MPIVALTITFAIQLAVCFGDEPAAPTYVLKVQ
jgi:hypothetical protein